MNVKKFIGTLLFVFLISFTFNVLSVIAESGSDSATVTVITNGVCSTSHYSCSVGQSVSNLDNVSTWTWGCNGDGGSNASCTENKPVNGSCGSSNSSSFYSAPSTNLCAQGSSSSVSGSGPWSWSCSGLYGGTTASCSASKKVDCIGSWVDNSTCSASCDWGVKQQTYTVTTSASNGGSSCPYTNGATQWGSTSCYIKACSTPASWSGYGVCSNGSQSGYCTEQTGGNSTTCASLGYSSGTNTRTCGTPASWSGYGACSNGIKSGYCTEASGGGAPTCAGLGYSAGTNTTSCGTPGVCSATHYSCSTGTSVSNSDNSSTWSWTCNGLSGGVNTACSENKPAPTATLTVLPSPVAYNGRPTITWSSTNATSCTTSANWSNSGTLSGSGLTNSLTATQTFTFQCTGNGQTSALKSVTVTVNPLNGVCSASHYNCTSGSSVSNSDNSSTWTWSCSGANGGTTDSCSENKPAPTATLTVLPSPVAYNGRPTITWSSTNATSCTTSANWSNSGTLSGSGLTDYLTSDTTYTFQCTGNGQTTALKSVTVTVGPAPSGTLSVTGCTIATNASTCNSKVTWTTANLSASPTEVTRNNPNGTSVSSLTSGTNVSEAVNSGTTNFYLYHGGIPIAPDVAITVGCGVMNHWDSSKCVLDTAIPIVGSQSSSSISYKSATLSANVTSLGLPASISARGFCYGTMTNPDLSNGAVCGVDGGNTTGAYSINIVDILSPLTTYYYRGYATNTTGAGYTGQGSFTTLQLPPPPEVTFWEMTNKTSVVAGDPIDLKWSTVRATTCSMTSAPSSLVNLPNLSANPTTAKRFNPTKTTIYKINCTGDGGSLEKVLKINVGTLKPTFNEL